MIGTGGKYLEPAPPAGPHGYPCSPKSTKSRGPGPSSLGPTVAALQPYFSSEEDATGHIAMPLSKAVTLSVQQST